VRVLATNDDGIESPGLHAMACALADLGHEVTVAAPAHDSSGSSASIGRIRADERIDVTPVTIPGAPAFRAFSVGGPPGLAAMAARLGAFGDEPELVVSGINAGLNTGHSTLHSGTVGAVLTARTFGASGLAISVEARRPWCWDTANKCMAEALEILLAAPSATVLNLNVPAREPDEVRGLRWASLDQFGSVRVALVDERSDAGVQMEFRATGASLDPDSDTALVERGWATLTALTGIEESTDWAAARAAGGDVHASTADTPSPVRPEPTFEPEASLPLREPAARRPE
jgi:5'-nucleotidase